MQGTTLRELARAFSKGELGRDQYRRDRSKLVTAIVAGEVAVKDIDFPPPIKPPGGDGRDATEPRPRRRRAESDREPESTTQITPARPRASTAPPARAKEAGPGRLIAIIVGVGIAAIAAWYFASRPARETPPATATAAVDASAEPAAATAVEPAEDPRAEAGRALISQFLQERNWSAERLASFQSEWSVLDAEQRAATLASTDAGRLASAIYERLLAQRALSGLGDAEESLVKQRELVGFAATLGITDPRLSVLEPAAASEAAATSPDAATTD